MRTLLRDSFRRACCQPLRSPAACPLPHRSCRCTGPSTDLMIIAMHSDIYWIDRGGAGRLAIMARPRAGEWLEDEVAHWRAVGVDTVVCLLEPAEIAELALADE